MFTAAGPSYETPEKRSATRMDIIELVEARLDNSRLSLKNGIDAIMAPLLAGKNPDDLEQLLAFARNSHLVPDETMCQVLGAVHDPNEHTGNAQLYVRSMKFICLEARQILRTYYDAYFDQPFASSFLESLESIPGIRLCS